jgi:hypothetical protein
MSKSMDPAYQSAIERYAPELLRATANRAARHLRLPKDLSPASRLAKALANSRSVARLVDELSEPARRTLAIMRRLPPGFWRWDHVMRLMTACQVPEPYEALGELLTDGLLCQLSADAKQPVEAVGVPRCDTQEALPAVAVAGPTWDALATLSVPKSPLTGKRANHWRAADGWEIPLRLAALWRLAARMPIRRTQQSSLFKRDRDRITSDPLLGAPMLDVISPIHEPGLLAYHLALAQGWLDPQEEEQAPNRRLTDFWPDNEVELLAFCADALIRVEGWVETPSIPVPSAAAREVTSARLLIVSWLAALPNGAGASIDQMAYALARVHPPWNRGHPADRTRGGRARLLAGQDTSARDWVRAFVLGPLYQFAIVECAGDPTEDCLVRLSPVGWSWVAGSPPDSTPTQPAHCLLVQPNHEVIVYRHGLTPALLARLMLFAEPKSLGAALTFEINADSVYHGLEAGCDADLILTLLESHSGRPVPPALAGSIRTWSAKRERIRVFAGASLLEFANADDLQAALARGLRAEPISDRLAILAPDCESDFRPFRITASRDYRLPAGPCIEAASDGVTLFIEPTTSDLLLEAELTRFAEPVSPGGADGRRQYRITSDSLARGFERGLTIHSLERWFVERAGSPPPPAVQLLFRASIGVSLPAKTLVVIRVETPILADGLLQHPQTAPLVCDRLGPYTLAVRPEDMQRFADILSRIGIKVDQWSGLSG